MESDKTRLFKGAGMLSVYVPPQPPPDVDSSDLPPGKAPEVRYFGVAANYWSVLREGSMTYRGGTKVFSKEQMAWLQSVEAQVEALLDSGRRT